MSSYKTNRAVSSRE